MNDMIIDIHNQINKYKELHQYNSIYLILTGDFGIDSGSILDQSNDYKTIINV